MYVKEKILSENYKPVYKQWRGRNPKRTNVEAKLLLNQKNYILKAKIIPTVDIDNACKNIRRKIWKEDHKRGTDSSNGMVTITPTGEEEINNMVRLGKNSETEAWDHTIGNRLKEELQIMWHKVRLL
jgi:hypothetical protein